MILCKSKSPVVSLLLATLLVSCSNGTTDSTQAIRTESNNQAVEAKDIIRLTPEQTTSIGLETASPVTMEMSSTILVRGKLEVPPQNLLSIHAPLGGTVSKANILPGEHVKKGQVLVVLSDQEFVKLQEAYLTLKEKLAMASLELTRQETLAADNISARRALEQARTDVKTLAISTKAAQERLALIGINSKDLSEENISRFVSITAPFSGFVSSVFVNTGTALNPHEKVLEMVDPSHIHAELQVYERDIPYLHPEQPMEVTLAGENAPRNGHVHLVGTEIRSDKTTLVHGHLDKADPMLRPGTSLTARIQLTAHTTIAIPQSAVVTANKTAWIYIQTAERSFRKTPITTGATQNGYIEVLTPTLNKSVKVVVKGAQAIE